MRRPLLLVLALAATALAAPDAFDPHAEVREPGVGERRRVRWSERITQRLERTLEGAPAPRVLETDDRTEATWVEEVLTAEGVDPRQVRVTFERWKLTTAAGEDTCLEGRSAVVSREVGTGRSPVRLDPLRPGPSMAAARFLDLLADRLQASSPLEMALYPRSKVVPGETWDALRFAPTLLPGAPFTRVVSERSKATVTLRALQGGLATLALEGALQLETAPGAEDRFVEGGRCTLVVTATFPPGTRPAHGKVERVCEVSGTTAGRLPDGKTYRTLVTLRHELRSDEEPVTK